MGGPLKGAFFRYDSDEFLKSGSELERHTLAGLYKPTGGGVEPHILRWTSGGRRRGGIGMNPVVVISWFLTAASVSAGFLPVPHITTTQHHSQDELGGYSYGYSGGPSAKEETRTADGVTRGSYSYIDANGIVQSASYVADPVHGFRVAATNLPQAPSAVSVPVAVAPVAVAQSSPGFDHVHGVPFETPEVVAAKAAHFAAHNEALARLSGRWKRSLPVPTGKSYSIFTPSLSTTVVGSPFPTGRSFSYSTIATAPLTAPAPATIAYSAPAPTYSAPAFAVPVSSHHQSQDELGQYSYGYSDGLSSKSESRTADGTTHGSYSYLDSNGIVQSVKYIADAGGFRVHASNLPVGP